MTEQEFTEKYPQLLSSIKSAFSTKGVSNFVFQDAMTGEDGVTRVTYVHPRSKSIYAKVTYSKKNLGGIEVQVMAD